MAKKRTIRKKASRSGKAQHDSEILRAKRAVSAALGGGASPTPPPVAKSSATTKAPKLSQKLPLDASTDSDQPAAGSLIAQPLARRSPGVMKGLVRVASGLLGRAVPPAADESYPARQPSLTVSCPRDASPNPLADLARRHASQPGKSLPGFAQHTDELCHQVLANLAKTALQSSSQPH